MLLVVSLSAVRVTSPTYGTVVTQLTEQTRTSLGIRTGNNRVFGSTVDLPSRLAGRSQRMFTVHLTWAEEARTDRREAELYPVEVPALPPDGTTIHLSRREAGEYLWPKVIHFEVEVVGAPILYAENDGTPAEFWLEVVPADED